MINTEPQREHRYILRSCLNCCNLPNCHVRYEVDSISIWADKAKYGCKIYSSTVDEYINEQPTKEKIQRLK